MKKLMYEKIENEKKGYLLCEYKDALKLEPNLSTIIVHKKFNEIQKLYGMFFFYVTRKKAANILNMSPSLLSKLIFLKFSCNKDGLYLLLPFYAENAEKNRNQVCILQEFIQFMESIFPSIKESTKWNNMIFEFNQLKEEVDLIQVIMEKEVENWIKKKQLSVHRWHNLFFPTAKYNKQEKRKIKLIKQMKVTKMYNTIIVNNRFKINLDFLMKL